MSVSGWFLVVILQTSPTVVADVGFKFDSEAECQAVVTETSKIKRLDKFVVDCWKIEIGDKPSKQQNPDYL